jgi:hypothetical protein
MCWILEFDCHTTSSTFGLKVIVSDVQQAKKRNVEPSGTTMELLTTPPMIAQPEPRAGVMARSSLV